MNYFKVISESGERKRWTGFATDFEEMRDLKKWKKKAKSLLAVFLCVSVCITSLPIQAFAQGEATQQEAAADAAGEPRQELDKDPVIVGEATLGRDAYTKRFATSDRSYIAAVYEEPVHYQNGEQWEDIDNRLELQQDAESGPVYTNKASDVDVQFVKTSGEGKLVTVTWQEDRIAWGLNPAGSYQPPSSDEESTDFEEEPEAAEETSPSEGDSASSGEAPPASEGQPDSSLQDASEGSAEKQEGAVSSVLPAGLKAEDGAGSATAGQTFGAGEETSSMVPSEPDVPSDVPVELEQAVAVQPSEFQVDPAEEEPVAALFSAPVNPEELTDSAEIEEYNREQTAVKNLTSSGIYEEILPGIDLRYILHSNAIKENIIVKNREAVSLLPLSFTIDHPGLAIRKEEDGSLSLYKEEEPEKAVFTFLAPFMSDANGAVSYDVEYQVSESGQEGQSVLTVVPDREWLEDEQRVFPLLIDPITKTETSSNEPIKEAFVTQVDPNTNFGNVEFMTTGSTRSGHKTRSLIKFDNLPELDNRATIRRAYLRLTTFDTEGAGIAYNPPLRNPYQDGETVQVNAYRMTTNWNTSSVTWNSLWSASYLVGYDRNAIDYAKVDKHAQYHWDITKAVKGWYRDPSTNYGIMLTNDDETSATNRVYFSTSDWALVNQSQAIKDLYYPIVELLYCNNSGLEDYWSYHSQSVGRAGTGYVNDHTGKLVFVHDDTATPGSRMPVAVSTIFNSTQEQWNFKHSPWDYGVNNGGTDCLPRTGMGWKLNLHQTLVPVDASLGLTEEYKYVFTDSDGTEHYFYEKDGKIIDEDGLGMEVKNGREAKMIEMKDGSKLDFDSEGRLEVITDTNGNVMEIEWTYKLGVWVITGVSDAAGNHISFEIDWNDFMLMSMTDQAGRKTTFHYDRDNTYIHRFLDGITYPDGTTTHFYYNKTGGYDQYQLTGVENADGYRVNYTYNNRKQVTKVTEKNGNATGQEMQISYGDDNTTTFRTSGRDDVIGNSDDILETYTFNYDGQTKSISSELADGTHLGGANYEYTSPSGKTGDRKQNRIKTGSQVGKNAVNLLESHSAEADSSAWIQAGKSMATFSYANESYMGERSFHIDKPAAAGKGRVYWLQQLNTLQNGKTYTLSAYVKYKGDDPDNVRLCAGTEVNSEMIFAYSDPVTHRNGEEWERLSVTFTIPEERTYPWTWIYLNMETKEDSEVYFDCVQLEEGETMSPYNFVENAGFEFNASGLPKYWQSATIAHGEQGYSSGEKFGRAVTMESEPSYSSGIKQECAVTATEKDTFIISGWGKANSLPGTKGDATFGIPVVIRYADGYEKKIECSFNFDTTAWQYVSKAFTLDDGTSTEREPVAIEVCAEYKNNMNQAYFDNIQLIKDDAPTYTYDNEGNLVSATQMEQDSQFAYSNDNLSKIMDAKGNFTYYNYDSETENVTVARNRQGIEYNYSYDTYGNVTEAVVQGKPNAGPPLKGNDYYIRNKRSGLYIDISDASTAYGAAVIQFDAQRTDHQKFYILGADMDDGYFCFIRACHGKNIGFGPKDYTDEEGAQIVTMSDSGIRASQWYLQYNEDDGSYSFKNKATGKYLDLASDSNERLVNLVQKSKDASSPSQRWFLEPAESTGGQMTASATYTQNGAFLDTITDNFGYQTEYEYDQNRGNLTTVIKNATLDSEQIVNYTYDLHNDKLLSTSQQIEDQIVVNNYSYDGDKLESISHGDVLYNFFYDQWGNPLQTKLNDKTLMTNIYAQGNGKLEKTIYGNGDSISYIYDQQERQSQRKYNEMLAFEWKYNNQGQLVRHQDYINNVEYNYSYDSLGRLLNLKGSDGTKAKYCYDPYNQITNAEYYIGGILLGIRPKYNIFDQITEFRNIFGKNEQNVLYYDYDNLGRPIKIRLYDYSKDKYLNESTYEYFSPAEGKTSDLISRYKSKDIIYEFEYDDSRNITKILENGVEKVSYEYDDFNQLIRENNKDANITTLYTYDTNGNLKEKREFSYTIANVSDIIEKGKTYSYSYVGDELTRYNGEEVINDELGNPIYRNGWQLTWENGQMLATAKKNNKMIYYQYNVSGLRTQKKINDITTNYYYEGGRLLGEERGDSDTNIYYYYDTSGKKLGCDIMI